MSRLIILLLLSSLLISGCISSGKGMIAASDENYFKEFPKIVTHEGKYYLRFRYADKPLFYMYASTKIQDNTLVLYIPVTTSTGYRAGKLHYQEIGLQEQIKLAKEDAVFWENPGGQLVQLKVEPMNEEDIEMIREKDVQPKQ
jgi:hypothetical protein